MDNPADNLDQTDEDILTYTVSDDALEAAAGIEGGCVTWPSPLAPGAPRRSRCHPGANALGRMDVIAVCAKRRTSLPPANPDLEVYRAVPALVHSGGLEAAAGMHYCVVLVRNPGPDNQRAKGRCARRYPCA
jgi:hypothetical protein